MVSENIYIRDLSGSLHHFPSEHHNGDNLCLKQINEFITTRLGIPPHLQILSHNGHRLHSSTAPTIDTNTTHPYIEIHLSLSLSGGKGGFGSLLRAAGKVSRTTNHLAMRDLSGRRSRYVKQEELLLQWSDEQKTAREGGDGTNNGPSSDMGEIHKDFAHIKKYGRPTEKRSCHRGLDCPYRWKCPFTHPDDKELAIKAKKSQKVGRFGIIPDSAITASYSGPQTERQLQTALIAGKLHADRMRSFKRSQKEIQTKKLLTVYGSELSELSADDIDENVDKDTDTSGIDVAMAEKAAAASSFQQHEEESYKQARVMIQAQLDKTDYKNIDINRTGLLTRYHEHKLVFNVRRDCDFVICDHCNRAYIGCSWHCTKKCDFDLCDNCVSISDDLLPLDQQNLQLSIPTHITTDTSTTATTTATTTAADVNSDTNNSGNGNVSGSGSSGVILHSKIQTHKDTTVSIFSKKMHRKRKRKERKLGLLGLEDDDYDAESDLMPPPSKRHHTNTAADTVAKPIPKTVTFADETTPKTDDVAMEATTVTATDDKNNETETTTADETVAEKTTDDTTVKESSPFRLANPIMGEVDLLPYENAQQLEAIGMEALKQELLAYGLKCGGTLTERGQRLFLIRHTPIDKLPKNCLSAKGKKKLKQKNKNAQ